MITETYPLKNIEIRSFLTKLNDYKIGELIITSVEFDGLMNGYDRKLLKFLDNKMKMPVIYKGGVKNLEDVKEIYNNNFKAVSSSSIFIMKKIDGGIVLNYPSLKERSKLL